MSLQLQHPLIIVDPAVTKQKLVVVEEEEEEEDAESSDSSSAGSPPSSSDQEDHNEDDRRTKNGSFSSFRSLEESLPLKRGLSNYFSGKSRSFSNLSDCGNANVEELAKPENPFNKRQRILTSLSRRASCSSIATAAMPSLFSPQHAVKEEEDEDNEEGDEFEGRGRRPVSSLLLRRKMRKNNAAAFRPTSSFSDLQSVQLLSK